MFRNRSVIEVMIMVFTFVVGFMIVGLSVLILIVEVSGILGALLGLIAGKSTGGAGLNTRPDGTDDDINRPIT